LIIGNMLDSIVSLNLLKYPPLFIYWNVTFVLTIVCIRDTPLAYLHTGEIVFCVFRWH